MKKNSDIHSEKTPSILSKKETQKKPNRSEIILKESNVKDIFAH